MEKYVCTECSYLYRPAFGEEVEGIIPGTSFDSIPESFACPGCGASKDAFFVVTERVNDPIDKEDISEAELCHIPFYRITREGIEVRVGDIEVPHPDEEGHFIEWIAIFDEDGEMRDVRVRPDITGLIVFEGFEEGDFSEVRAACVLHGIWKGIECTNPS